MGGEVGLAQRLADCGVLQLLELEEDLTQVFLDDVLIHPELAGGLLDEEGSRPGGIGGPGCPTPSLRASIVPLGMPTLGSRASMSMAVSYTRG
jgi:hypothetical protein